MNQSEDEIERTLKILDSTQIDILAKSAMAKRLAKKSQNAFQITHLDQAFSISFAQQRLWFLILLDENVSTAYNIPLAWRLYGSLDITAWQGSLDALFARHQALRTIFISIEGEPHIKILPSEIRVPFEIHDLQGQSDAEATLRQLSLQEAQTPFNLAQGPLIRAHLVRLSPDTHVFLLTLHHIVFDGWSMSILIQELSAFYNAFSQGQDSPLLPLDVQYPDYAVWQRQWLTGERLATQIAYWRETLADAPVFLNLPTDRPRPAQQSFGGAMVPVQIDAQLTGDLKRLSQQQNTTLFMTLLTAWAIVLARLSGQNDLIIGTPTANRNHREVESLIGFFVNTLALRIDLSGEPSVADLLARVRKMALAAQDHQDLPFEQVVEIVKPPRQLSHTPLFQAVFAWQNNYTGSFNFTDLTIEPIPSLINSVKFDLTLDLCEIDNGSINGTIQYATALFDATAIEEHRGYLLTVLRSLVIDTQQPVDRIDLLSTAERTRLINT